MDHDIRQWAIWGGCALVVVLILIAIPWIREWWLTRNLPEVGADEEWADPDTGELGQMLEYTRIDRSLGDTDQVDMADLRTKLDLEDVELDIRKQSDEVLGHVIHILTDDGEWKRYMHKGRHRRANALND